MPSGMIAATHPPSAPRLASMPSMKGPAQVKTA